MAPDSLHVITLARRRDRLAAFRARTVELPYWFRVEPGIEPKETPEDWVGSPASYGNALAHRAVLEKTNGITAIFEDDAVLTPGLDTAIDAALSAMPTDWELLMLGAGRIGYGSRFRPPVHDIVSFQLTHAYIVSDAGRDAVLDANYGARYHWDHLLGHHLGQRGRTWLLQPPLHQDDTLGSDIPDSGRKARYVP